MDQVYWGCLQRDLSLAEGWRWLETPRVTQPDIVASYSEKCVGLGSGWDRYSKILDQRGSATVIEGRFPMAAHQARISLRRLSADGCEDQIRALPTYVRDEVTN